jgi:hypothetical protein
MPALKQGEFVGSLDCGTTLVQHFELRMAWTHRDMV